MKIDSDPRDVLGDWLLVAEHAFYRWRLFVLRNRPRLGMCCCLKRYLSDQNCNFCSGGSCSWVLGLRGPCEPLLLSYPLIDIHFFRSLFSFLPPSTTLRGYQRQSLATTASEIGSVYCSVVSFASSSHAEDPQNVVQSLVAIRMKLKRSIVLRANIIYEVSLINEGIPLFRLMNFIVFPAWAMASRKVSENFGDSAVGIY
jgi:hypothetical protein